MKLIVEIIVVSVMCDDWLNYMIGMVSGECLVVFVDDDFVCFLNCDYRGWNKVINVFFFFSVYVLNGLYCLWGDVVVFLEIVCKEVDVQGKFVVDYIVYLLVYGVLYFIGMDYDEDFEV